MTVSMSNGVSLGNLVTAQTDAVTGGISGFNGFGSAFGSSAIDRLLFGTDTWGAGKELVNITKVDANAGAVARPTTLYVKTTPAPTVSDTVDFHGVDALMTAGGENANFTANTRFYAVEGKSTFNASAGQTLGNAVGVFGTGINSSSSGTLTKATGVMAGVQNTGTGTTTSGFAFYAAAPTVSAGAMTTAYGLYMESMTAATTNYAIQTNTGYIWFHANKAMPAGGTYKTGVLLSSTNAFGIFFGSGAPSISAGKGSLYLRSDGTGVADRMYVNTDGSTAWTAVTTAG